jgi:Cof subfamily protein (haloacid dehalogenase superfamily)
MKYPLFITDYDGTLGCAPNNDINPQTLQAINEFVDKGGKFVVCSGREYRSIKKILLNSNLKGLVVCFQGALIADLESGEVLFEGGIAEDFAISLLEKVSTYGLYPIVYYKNSFYADGENKDSPYYKYYADIVKMEYLSADLKTLIKEKGKPCKLGWLGPDEVVVKAQREMNELFGGKEIVFNSGASGLLEAVNPQCDKGKAVRFLAKYYSIPLDKVLAVGDSTNDIPLINGEWHGVAVGDGKEQLKQVAKEITVPFSEQPVKLLLEKYCL